MKCIDLCHLSLREIKQERKEGVLYTIMVDLILTCIIVLLTLANNSGMIADSILKGTSDNGERTYSFYLKGFLESDIDELVDMGFYSITFPQKGMPSGIIDSINGIWGLKIQALFEGRDIWSSSLDEILVVQLFCALILYALSIILCLIFFLILSNSYSMKLVIRERYICMMSSIGYHKSTVHTIIAGSFGIKIVVALFHAEISAIMLIKGVNNFLTESIGKHITVPIFSPSLLVVILVLCSGSVMVVSLNRSRKKA